VSTRLAVGTLLVLPQGALDVGTEVAPVATGATADLVIADEPIDLSDDGVGTFDPHQYGAGLPAVDGRVRMHGAVRTGYVRLAAEPRAGDRTLRVVAPLNGWRAGDRLFLPDSKHYAIETGPHVDEGEVMTLVSVGANWIAASWLLLPGWSLR
jgi:hypothetical protein